MVDDKETVTEKILNAFLITKQRLLLSKSVLHTLPPACFLAHKSH